ncbi:hypothetical protein LEP1GSC121_1446 [Leptospira borgpetersenii serovar Castellonis str. 200801910]|nr:hypothetical protein LEP1GSC121_1446 [Leptospira borgpetersenii serovar Castellonis str. 200801910]EMN15283.1 hypothetical protein LEP1GSC055_2808 [Leptospira borgpetersenii str. Brem 307]
MWGEIPIPDLDPMLGLALALETIQVLQALQERMRVPLRVLP